jgi:hypothetical protein
VKVPETLQLGLHNETLIAVVIGAVLATLSGIVATQIETRLHRRERERDAALFFGELISTLGVLLDNAIASRGRGDPYGVVTLRLLRACRREIDLYDRNRTSLYDLRASGLRIKVHAFMVRTAMPLDGILDSSDVLAVAPTDAEAGPRFEAARVGRDIAFDFLIEMYAEIPALIAELSRPARSRFDSYTGPALPGPANSAAEG